MTPDPRRRTATTHPAVRRLGPGASPACPPPCSRASTGTGLARRLLRLLPAVLHHHLRHDLLRQLRQRADGHPGRPGPGASTSCRPRRRPRWTRRCTSPPAPPWTPRSTQVRKGDCRRRDRAAGRHADRALLVRRPGHRGDRAGHLQRLREPGRTSPRRACRPRYTLQTPAGRGRVAQAHPVHRPRHDRLRHRGGRGVRCGDDADHLAAEAVAAPATARAGVRPGPWSPPGSWCRWWSRSCSWCSSSASRCCRSSA